MSTTTSIFQPGDVLILDLPFTDASGLKRRPAIVLLDTGDADAVVAPVTTRFHGSRYDVTITH